MLDNFTKEHIESVMSVEKAQENIANWQSAYQHWLDKGEQEFAQFWLEMAESEKQRLQAIKKYKALQWCDERGTSVKHTESNVIVDIPGFDTIIASTLQEAVQLARELEEPVQLTLKGVGKHCDLCGGGEGEEVHNCPAQAPADVFAQPISEFEDIPNPSWLPSKAELDAAECELAMRELEEGQQAYREMVEDESRALNTFYSSVES